MSMSFQSHKITRWQDCKMMIRDYAWLMISRSSRSHSYQVKDTSQSLKSKITTTYHRLMIEVKDYEFKTKVKALYASRGPEIVGILRPGRRAEDTHELTKKEIIYAVRNSRIVSRRLADIQKVNSINGEVESVAIPTTYKVVSILQDEGEYSLIRVRDQVRIKVDTCGVIATCQACNWEKVWDDIPTLHLGFVWAGKMEFGKVGSFGPSSLYNFVAKLRPHGVPTMKRLFKVAMLDPSPEFIGPWGMSGDLGLPIVFLKLDSAIWKNLGYSEWSTPAGLKLARENLQSRVKEEDSITDVENDSYDLDVMDSSLFFS
ncbi:hypothetical protein Tco_1246346 [Tanacetum coccineum]